MTKESFARPADSLEAVLRLTGTTLLEDEEMVAAAIIHPAIYWKGVAVIILAFILLATVTMTNLGWFFFVVGAIMLILAHMTRHYLLLAATNKRIFIRSGILYADMIEMRYTQTESVELGMTPIGQIFRYANVIVTGTGQRRVIVPFVANAIPFRSKVNEILVNK